jgi:GAF domain-containing protein
VTVSANPVGSTTVPGEVRMLVTPASALSKAHGHPRWTPMVDRNALLRACGEFVRTIVCQYDIDEVLSRVTVQIAETLSASGAAVSLAEEGRLRFVAATDPGLAAVEGTERGIAEGPTHEAWRTGRAVAVADLRSSGRWPCYAAVALLAGQRAVAGVPMTVADECIGAVTIYHTDAYAWPVEDLDAAELLADMAAGYIANQRALERSRRLAGELQQALDSRVIIEQAKGVLAERHGLDADAAFERLRRHARSHNRTLHAVARDVVAGTLDL